MKLFFFRRIDRYPIKAFSIRFCRWEQVKTLNFKTVELYFRIFVLFLKKVRFSAKMARRLHAADRKFGQTCTNIFIITLYTINRISFITKLKHYHVCRWNLLYVNVQVNLQVMCITGEFTGTEVHIYMWITGELQVNLQVNYRWIYRWCLLQVMFFYCIICAFTGDLQLLEQI